MKSKDSFRTKHPPSPDKDSGQTVAHDEGEIREKHETAKPPGHDTQILRAETRTKQAEARTEAANTRTEQAEMRTEKAEAQSASLHASEISYRRLFEAAQDGILILEFDTGRVSDVNPFLVELLGISHEEMVGKTVGELSPFRDIVANQKVLERLQNDGYVRYEDLPLETRDGRQISVEFVSNVYQARGTKVIQCNIRDITERKQAEMSHARLAMAVAQAAENIVITDTNGAILYANPAFEKTTGYTIAEVLGQNSRLLKSGKHDAAFYRRMWDVLERGEVWHGHMINRRKDGKVYEEEATISPVRDAAGTIVNYVAVKRDVTREVQLESQFRQAQKMEAIGTLAGGVAHDFNNILAVIQMQAGLLKERDGLTDEQSNCADEIGVTVARGAALTRQLLLFSRRESFQPRDLDLSNSITTTTKMLRRMLGETIKVQLKLAAQPMLIHADPGMMDQVLMNLAVNARDSMPDGGQLVIETSGVEFDEFAAAQSALARPGSFACLSVSDNGKGIPPEILPRIFEPFFTTKDVGKGTGLGLATVFGIVQQHQGWINVYSEAGQGTTFRIYLPRLTRSAEAKSSPPAPTAMRGGKETILLVEDEPSLRVSVRMTLSRLGYRILEAPTGVKALEVWKENRDEIRLLLTDLVMPDGVTGIALAQRLLQENSKLKVIYMSGYSAAVAGKGFLMQEGVNFLTKPFAAQELARTIRDRLDNDA
ncbi:MAG: PAS domain S-box protein [Verrucomicrobia bacterium]|nr:PAS domain S-box protein [Verrucomicrobiota bacterium]